MTKSALVVLGIVALGFAAAGVYRELSPARTDAGGSPIPAAAVAGGALPTGPIETPRPVPELRFVDGTGAPRSLADFRGRVVLLNIWATWCVPCRKEMPALDRLQAALGGPGFEVVALSIDRGGVFAVKSFYEGLDLRALRVYVDGSGEALTKLRALGIPLTLLVDTEGRELWRVVGPVEWDEPAVADRIRSAIPAAPKR